MEQFRRDNTEGYSENDLMELNERFARAWQAEELDDEDMDDFDRRQLTQHIAEQVQYAFDKEHPRTGRRLTGGYGYDVED